MASGNITPEQFKQACTNAIKVVQNNIGNILINATNIGSGELQYRVFNEGKTVAGKKMEYRNAPSNYTRLRKDAGLQVRWKDLQFTGNLFYSMNILSTKNNEVVYGFNNNKTAEIAHYQETSPLQVNEPIFELSQKEVNIMEAQFARDVTRIFTSALENFPEMPTVKKDNDPNKAINKSIARNQKKNRNKKTSASVNKLDKSIKTKQNRLNTQKQKLASTNIKTSNTIKKKQKLEKELKANEYKRINTDKRKEYLQGYIKRKQSFVKMNEAKLAKSRKGSKASAEYARKLAVHKKEMGNAKKALAEVNKVKPLKKQVSTQTKKLKSLRESYKTQSTTHKTYKKKTSAKLREEQRIKRAKQLRMGTYKPTKRK